MSEIILNATLETEAKELKASLEPSVITNVKWGAIKGTIENQEDLTEYVVSSIANAVGGITSFDYQVVEELPTEAVKGTIYLVPNSKGKNDIYDEYLYVNGDYEKIGTTKIDLTGYATQSWVEEYIASLNATNEEY